MPEHKGVHYTMRWRGLWEWEIFAQKGHGTPTCKGTLECSGPEEDFRCVAEASIHVEIDELLARGLFQGRESSALTALKNTLQEFAVDLSHTAEQLLPPGERRPAYDIHVSSDVQTC